MHPLTTVNQEHANDLTQYILCEYSGFVAVLPTLDSLKSTERTLSKYIRVLKLNDTNFASTER